MKEKHWTALGRLIDIEHTRRGCTWSWHVWIGPAGLHIFWPPWTSRLDWCSSWREPLE